MKKVFVISIFYILFNFFPLNLTGINKKIEIIDSIKIIVPPAEGVFYERFLNTPLLVMEGLGDEIIIWRGSYLQIYSSEGKPICKVGKSGEGPGEFHIISDIEKTDGLYYILDFPNKLNIFDKNFIFQKRIFLEGERNSPFIYDFSLEDNTIVTAQRWRSETGFPRKDKTISVYSINGKWINAFFKKKEGWDNFPNDSILGGKIILINKCIYFCYQPINLIWKLSLTGKVLRKKTIGKSWWKKINYTRKDELKAKRSPSYPRNFYENVLSSGYIIDKMYYYRKNLVLRIIYDDGRGNAETLLILLDLDLNREEGPYYLKNYVLSGVGLKYLYFTKYLGEYSQLRKNEVELLKCRLSN